MQHVFIGILQGAVQPAVLRTAVAVVDFIYYSRLHIHTSKTLVALESALKTFHDNKHIIIDAGVREHFNIPKIHQMIHYAASIHSRGSPDGYNTENSERLHIDFAKEAYRASNKRDYVKQMTAWMGRQEAAARFRSYLDWTTCADLQARCKRTQRQEDSYEDIDEDDEDFVDQSSVPNPNQVSKFHMSIVPAFPRLYVDDIMARFIAPRFIYSLQRYILKHYPPPQKPLLPNMTDRFDLYKILTIPLPDLPTVGRLKQVNRIRVTPAVSTGKGTNFTPAHFDTILVRCEDERENLNMKGTSLEGEYHINNLDQLSNYNLKDSESLKSVLFSPYLTIFMRPVLPRFWLMLNGSHHLIVVRARHRAGILCHAIEHDNL